MTSLYAFSCNPRDQIDSAVGRKRLFLSRLDKHNVNKTWF